MVADQEGHRETVHICGFGSMWKVRVRRELKQCRHRHHVCMGQHISGLMLPRKTSCLTVPERRPRGVGASSSSL